MSAERKILPSRVLFSVIVLGALAYAYVSEQRHRIDPAAGFRVQPEERPAFEPLEPPAREHALVGEVRDASGAPVAGAQVFLHRAEPDETSAEPLHLTFTDASGRFRMGELEARRYGVVLEARGFAPRTLEVGVPPVDGGGVVWDLGAPLEPLPALPEMRRGDFDGIVQAPRSGGVVEGYEVVLRPAARSHPLSGAVVRRARTDAAGRFRFEGLVATDYELELLPAWAAGGSWPVLARASFAYDPGRDFAPTLVPRTARVVGRVVDEDGTPVEGALVRVDTPDPELEDAAAPRHRIWPPTSTDREGRFALDDLSPETYRLRVHAGRAVFERELDIRDDAPLDLGTIRVAPSGAGDGES